jgi:SAM-dependent methyltransferase
MVRKDLHEANRASWNMATVAHNSHKGDQAAHFRAGRSTLYPEELELLGDLRGKQVVHLQCNAGQDTLSLARLGAEVTGVDISDTAIEFARALSRDAGIPARFERSDVYDWLAETAHGPERFDIAFSSYGALIWLSDIAAWVRGVASILRPGGRLVVVEFHPYASTFEEGWKLTYPYFNGGEAMVWEEGIEDYVAASRSELGGRPYEEEVVDFRNPHPTHEWCWSIAEILTAVLEAGLILTAFREYPYCNGLRMFPDMVECPGRRWVPPEGVPSIPLMYSFAALLPEQR